MKTFKNREEFNEWLASIRTNSIQVEYEGLGGVFDKNTLFFMFQSDKVKWNKVRIAVLCK